MKSISTLIFRVSLFVCLLITVVAVVIAAISNQSIRNVFLFLSGVWTAVFVAVLIIIWLGFFIIIDLRIYKRTQEIEEVLPDYLQLAAANISSGMPIDKALWYAVRPRFGVLAKEIEDVAKSTLTGEDLGVALRRFSGKYDSPTLKRSIDLLLEGVAAGGQMADLLTKISVNIQETRIMQKQMAANIMSYVIFIGFAALVASPFLLRLSTQLIVVIKSILGNLNLGDTASASTFAFSLDGDSIKLSDFKLFSMAVLLVTSTFSMAIVGTIRYGSARRMLPYMPAMFLVSLLIYFAVVAIFGAMLGGFF